MWPLHMVRKGTKIFQSTVIYVMLYSRAGALKPCNAIDGITWLLVCRRCKDQKKHGDLCPLQK